MRVPGRSRTFQGRLLGSDRVRRVGAEAPIHSTALEEVERGVQGGLEQGDVIVSVDGRAVESAGGLQEMIAMRHEGERVQVELYRDGRLEHRDVRLGAAPVNGADRRTVAPVANGLAIAERLGVTVQPLTNELAQRLGFAEAKGLVVVDVDALGPAASRGIGAGVAMRQIDGEAVNDLDDLPRRSPTGSPVRWSPS